MPHILIVDDEALMRDMLERVLKSRGFTVSLAEDGQEGVRQQRNAPADVVIMDLFMPRQEGLETIMYFRKVFPEVPIIAISGNPIRSSMLSIAQRLGSVAVFQKPFNAVELLRAVEEALSTRAPSAIQNEAEGEAES